MRARKAAFFSPDGPKPRMTKEDRAFVGSLYRHSVQRLEDMTGRDLPAWQA